MKRTTLTLAEFRDMDYLAISEFGLPIELMMENAGLQLARLVVKHVNGTDAQIYIGAGNGNNGGGGLVAARRLQAWGFHTHLHLPFEITSELPKRQLDRALKFGAVADKPSTVDVRVDAYLGFSQKLPLGAELVATVQEANSLDCRRISLDIPTGISDGDNDERFDAHAILTMAAPKFVLQNLKTNPDIYLADLGIPKAIYDTFGIDQPAFTQDQLLKIN